MVSSFRHWMNFISVASFRDSATSSGWVNDLLLFCGTKSRATGEPQCEQLEFDDVHIASLHESFFHELGFIVLV